MTNTLGTKTSLGGPFFENLNVVCFSFLFFRLDNSVFGKFESITLSSNLKGTLNATRPTPSPSPSPEPTISPYPASPVHSPAPSPDTVIISHQHHPRYLHILVRVHTAVLEFLQAPHQLLILTLLFLLLMHLMVPLTRLLRVPHLNCPPMCYLHLWCPMLPVQETREVHKTWFLHHLPHPCHVRYKQ